MRIAPLIIFTICWPLLMAASAQETTILLKVTEEETNTPIANAQVSVTEAKKESTAISLFHLAFGNGIANTDSEGTTLVRLSETRPPGVMVRVAKEGYVPRKIFWEARQPEFQYPQEFVLPLEKAQVIGGFIHDPDGKPIANAQVILIIRGSNSGRGQEIHNDIWEEKVSADEHGFWHFDGAPSSLQPMSLQVVHPDYVFEQPNRHWPEEKEFFAQTAVLQMQKGRLIEGNVRNGDGQPIPYVTVLMHEHGADSTQKPEYTTNSDGYFKIGNAPFESSGSMANGLILTFMSMNHAPEMAVIPSYPANQKINITLTSGKRLTGTVVDKNGKPIENAWVYPDRWRQFRPFCLRFVTDKSGSFVWEHAPEEEIQYDILAENYTPARDYLIQAKDSPVKIVLYPPTEVQAEVIDEATGQPIDAFEVTSGILWPNGGKYLDNTTPGKGGIFHWKFDEPVRGTDDANLAKTESGHFLRFKAPGYVETDSPVIYDGEEMVRLTVKLKRGADLPFVVQSKEGKPVAGAIVVVAGEDNPVVISQGQAQASEHPNFKTDDKGSLLLPPFTGSRTLIITHPEEGFACVPLSEMRGGKVTLTKWGKVEVNSPSIKKGEDPKFYLNYEPLDAQPDHVPLYYYSYDGIIKDDGATLFTGVKPGKVRIGIYGQADSNAVELDVPEGKLVKLDMSAKDGFVGFGGILNFPQDLPRPLFFEENVAMVSRNIEPLWPKGLGYQDAMKWLETEEGRKKLAQQRTYYLKFHDESRFSCPLVASGDYDLYIKVFSGPNTKDRVLQGCFFQPVHIPTKKELAAFAGNSEFGASSFGIEIQPPFYPVLQEGSKFPEFDSQVIKEPKVNSTWIKDKPTILILTAVFREGLDTLKTEITAALPDLAKRGIQVAILRQDLTKDLAEATSETAGIECATAWIPPERTQEHMKVFGPTGGQAVFALDQNGVILKRCLSFKEAAGAFAP